MIFPNAAERYLLEAAWSETKYLSLFVNNHTPSESTTIGSVVECSDMEYMQQTLSFGSVTTVSGKARRSATASNFTFNPTPEDPGPPRSSFTVYGYYIHDNAGALLSIERLSSPVTIDGSGGTISIPSPIVVRLSNPQS